MSRQLNELKEFVYQQSNKIKESLIEKLEYHERHDDKRFSDIVDDIWELRLRHAAVEGLILKTSPQKIKPKVDIS